MYVCMYVCILNIYIYNISIYTHTCICVSDKVSEHAGLAVGRRRRHGHGAAGPSGRARPRARVAGVPRGAHGRPRAPPGAARPGTPRGPRARPPNPGRGATPGLAVGRRRRHGHPCISVPHCLWLRQNRLSGRGDRPGHVPSGPQNCCFEGFNSRPHRTNNLQIVIQCFGGFEPPALELGGSYPVIGNYKLDAWRLHASRSSEWPAQMRATSQPTNIAPYPTLCKLEARATMTELPAQYPGLNLVQLASKLELLRSEHFCVQSTSCCPQHATDNL